MIWLIGSGQMACEYARVLDGLEREYLVIGRGERSAAEFKSKTGRDVITGGLSGFLINKPKMPYCAIVCVGIESLNNVSQILVEYGVSLILIEKPGGIHRAEIIALKKQSDQAGCDIYIAYNRRFYSSVIEAKKIIRDDGGVNSFNFEFTEWSNIIEKLNKEPAVKERWFFANSTHVVDTAFFLGGIPIEYSCYTAGKQRLAWHPASSIYCGAGVTDMDALFSYQANWLAPGRWSLELLTCKSRLILRPMEDLQIQNNGSVEIRPYPLDNKLDKNYKPGLYLQVKAILGEDKKNLCHLNDHIKILDVYYRIAGYDKSIDAVDIPENISQ